MQFFINKTTDGYTNTKAYKAYLNSLPVGRYEVTIKKAKRRSTPQNAYYWGVVVPIVFKGLRDAGFELRNNDDAHSVIKQLFLKSAEEINGIKIEKIGSTAELKVSEFMDLLQNISVWAFDYLGVTIPEPNQQLQII